MRAKREPLPTILARLGELHDDRPSSRRNREPLPTILARLGGLFTGLTAIPPVFTSIGLFLIAF